MVFAVKKMAAALAVENDGTPSKMVNLVRLAPEANTGASAQSRTLLTGVASEKKCCDFHKTTN